ncbi:hypothetical protein ACFSTC_48675 [Nonomuraea ferruginea]
MISTLTLVGPSVPSALVSRLAMTLSPLRRGGLLLGGGRGGLGRRVLRLRRLGPALLLLAAAACRGGQHAAAGQRHDRDRQHQRLAHGH